jgi:predicted component of type VI protein secretion system
MSSAGAPMPPQLVAFPEGFKISIDKPIMLFGRDAECDIRFDSRKISRRHCCLAHVGDQLIVRDLGSTNGIRVNGVRVLEGYLRSGDELTVGSHRYQVVWDAAAPPAEKAPAATAEPAQATAAKPMRAPGSDEPIRLADSALLPPAKLPPPEPLEDSALITPPMPAPKESPSAFAIPDDIPLLMDEPQTPPPESSSR